MILVGLEYPSFPAWNLEGSKPQNGELQNSAMSKHGMGFRHGHVDVMGLQVVGKWRYEPL